MPSLERLRNLLREYATSESPRVKIMLLRLAIAEAMSLFPEALEPLAEADAKVRQASTSVNWEAFRSYAGFGRWEALNDKDYFKFARLIGALDSLAAAIWHLVGRVQKKRGDEVIGRLSEVVK